MNRSVMLNSLEVEATDKISDLLKDTVLLLCRNGFNFQLDIKVQGLIAVTLDKKEVFLVKFDESGCKVPSTDLMEDKLHDEISCQLASPPPHQPQQASSRKWKKRTGKKGRTHGSSVVAESRVKLEQNANHDGASVPAQGVAERGGGRENHEEQDSSSTVSVKEESDQDRFAPVNFQENDDVQMGGHQFPMFGHGMMTMKGEAEPREIDPLWSMQLGNVSGRGRRARRSGQKMYCCEHPGCGLSFYRSYTLYRHQRLKHGQRLVPSVSQQNKQASEFRCPIDGCGQIFARASVLEKHAREFHRNLCHQEEADPSGGHEGFLGKNDLERYDENDDLLFGASLEYGLLSR